MNPLKPAMGALPEILERLSAHQAALFIDYDGTLTPIVANPDLALLSEAVRQTLGALAGVCKVAVVSGRGLADVRARVGLDTLTYVGSHGFEIAAPQATADDPGAMLLEKGQAFLSTIDRVEGELRLRTGRIDGVLLERKPFGIALHYRQVAAHDVPTVTKYMNDVLREHPGLRVTAGKKIYDIRPDIDWDKGTAVRWVLARFQQQRSAGEPAFRAIYLGDDTTDEDAFRALRDGGITIAVQSGARPTAAEYCLSDTRAVQGFLGALLAELSKSCASPEPKTPDA